MKHCLTRHDNRRPDEFASDHDHAAVHMHRAGRRAVTARRDCGPLPRQSPSAAVHVELCSTSRSLLPQRFLEIRSAGFDEALGFFGVVFAFGFQRHRGGIRVVSRRRGSRRG